MWLWLSGGGRTSPLDQGGRHIRILKAASLVALLFAAAAFARGAEDFRSLKWIAPNHEVASLTTQPAMCPNPVLDTVQAEIGEALFHAPMLLGGQAARADVSCASCHSNGRRNAHFFLAGVSSELGTADVSSSFFSLARSNGRFDPKPIPDLARPGKISRDAATGNLERFLRGLIVEEFGGREPSKAALSALATYVRSVGDCEGEPEQSRKLADQIGLVRLSIQSASRMFQMGDPDTAALLVGGARHQLGLISERYRGKSLVKERSQLLAFSRALQPAAKSTAPERKQLDGWLGRFDRQLRPMLERSEAQSLYNPKLLMAQRDK